MQKRKKGSTFGRENGTDGLKTASGTHGMDRKKLFLGLAVAAAVAAVAMLWPRTPAAPNGAVIYADASFAPTLREASAAFAATAGLPVAVIEGTPSSFAAEIRSDAAATLLITQDTAAVDALAAEGLLVGEPVEIARNRLVFATAAPDELAAAKDGATYFAGGKLVTGNPATTALGRFALEALVNLGFPDEAEGYIAPAPSAEEAVAMLLDKAALEGILFRSDALAAPGITVLDEIPESAHTPIAYLAAPVAGGNPERASLLLDFLKSEAFKTILVDSGFDLPPEGEPAG